jgi:hypothetical protein
MFAKEMAMSAIWDESFYFTVSDASNHDELVVEECVYNTNKCIPGSKSFHGDIRTIRSSFAPLSGGTIPWMSMGCSHVCEVWAGSASTLR